MHFSVCVCLIPCVASATYAIICLCVCLFDSCVVPRVAGVFLLYQALRVVDYDEQALVAGFKSWFGGILCMDWSPDGRYIVVGGEVGTS